MYCELYVINIQYQTSYHDIVYGDLLSNLLFTIKAIFRIVSTRKISKMSIVFQSLCLYLYTFYVTYKNVQYDIMNLFIIILEFE